MKANDVITRVNGQALQGSTLEDSKPVFDEAGTHVTFTIQRDGAEIELTLVRECMDIEA